MDVITYGVLTKKIKGIEIGESVWGAITGTLADQTDLKNALDNKVNVETGKVLSSNDYTDTEKQKLFGIENNANYYVLPNNVVFDSNYVHTDNNFTTEEKQKLANQSGTNTGDETQTSIITKIGYTPANDLKVVHKTGDETIAGTKNFSGVVTANYITVSQGLTSGGRTRLADKLAVGNGYDYPVSTLHQDAGNGNSNYHKFTAGTTTGKTLTDGFDIGITGTGVAQIKQLENLNLEFYTNSVKVGDISNTGVWANNTGTWSTLSDERLKENIKPISNALDKCLAIAECVRQYTFKNQIKYASGQRTGYIAQLLQQNGFEGHITINNPIDEEEGVLLGWKYADETYIDEEEKEQTRRIVTKEGDKILGIENNFVPYLFAGFKELNYRLKTLEEKLNNL